MAASSTSTTSTATKAPAKKASSKTTSVKIETPAPAATVSPAKFAGAKAPAAPKARAPKPMPTKPAITMGSGPVALMRNQVGKPGAGSNAGLSRVVKERIAAAQANKQANYQKGLENQVAAARQSDPFTSLTAGSPAFVVAESILTLFTTVSPEMDGDKQVKSRTAVAVETALANLEDSFVLKHGGAIDLGKKRAFAALKAGFDNKSKPVVTAPTEV